MPYKHIDLIASASLQSFASLYVIEAENHKKFRCFAWVVVVYGKVG